MSAIFYLNGKLLPQHEAKISLLDYGFLYGYGLYETVRAYGKKAFRLDNHLARLKFSGEKLGILVHPGLLRDAVNDVIAANGFPQTRVRICVSAGEGSMKPDLDSCRQPTIAVLAMKYSPPAPLKYKNGYRVITSGIRRNSRSPVTYHKSSNTMEGMMARRETIYAGADEAIFLNEKGNVTETAGCNIFTVRNGTLFTPGYETGILPGVTRVVVFELATQLGLKYREVNIKPAQLMTAGEAFLTNSMIEIMPLSSVDGQPIGDGQPGVITRRLLQAYRRLVRKETREDCSVPCPD